MVNVLHVIGKRPTGGIGTVVKTYQKHIDSSEIHFDYLIFDDSPDGDFDAEARQMGSTVHVLPELRNTRLFLLNNRIKEFFEEHANDYQVVHLHSLNIGFMVLKYAKAAGIRVRIAHSHATRYSDKKLNAVRNYFLYKISLPYATDYFYCSDMAKEFIFSNQKNHLYKMNNAIDPTCFAFSNKNRNITKAQLGISDEQKVLIHTGRFNAQKNHSFLIDVMKQLDSFREDWCLLLVGDGELKRSIIDRALDAGISEKIKFLGRRDDIPSLLSAADCFLLPSLYEGLPLSIIEAECNGLQVIVSENVTQEIDFGEEFCTFLPIDDTESARMWAKAISSALDHQVAERELAYRLADNIHFNIKIEAREAADKYITLCENAY